VNLEGTHRPVIFIDDNRLGEPGQQLNIFSNAFETSMTAMKKTITITHSGKKSKTGSSKNEFPNNMDAQDHRFDRVATLVFKGIRFMEDGSEKKAMACFNSAIKIQSKNTSAWNNKGVCLLRMERYIEAINCFEKAIEIDPEYQLAWINKSIALLRAGDREGYGQSGLGSVMTR
jgi:tetratricopeptide (TPR) repeat protein